MKQYKNYASLALLAALLFSTVDAREPDPPFPESVKIDSSDTSLSKLGAYRYVYRLFFKLYDAALYAEPGAETDDVLAAQARYRLQFRYLREIDKSIILKSSARMLEKNLSAEESAQIADRVERLNQAYRTVKEGDRSSLTYEPGVGTTLSINGSEVVTIEGDDFARLYFKIWLGEEPISTTLRENLLGLVE